MKWFYFFILLFCCCGCDEEAYKEQEKKQLLEKPIFVAEKNGITVWKVRDRTFGGRSYVYFTTPTGFVLEQE